MLCGAQRLDALNPQVESEVFEGAPTSPKDWGECRSEYRMVCSKGRGADASSGPTTKVSEVSSGFCALCGEKDRKERGLKHRATAEPIAA